MIKSANKEDWFHSILEYLYKKPLNGQWHDLRNLFGAERQIWFAPEEKRSGYKRINYIAQFLKAKNFIELSYEPVPGKEAPKFVHAPLLDGKNLGLGEEPNSHFIDETRTTDVEGNEHTLQWMARITPEGYSYFEQRETRIEGHKSALRTNRWIIAASIFAIISIIINSFGIWITHQDSLRAQERNLLLEKQNKLQPQHDLRIYINDSLRIAPTN